MASVFGAVAGGDPVKLEADTVADVRLDLEIQGPHTVTVDGDTVDDDYVLSDNQFVCFAPAAKGGSF